MKQLTYIQNGKLEWWEVPEPTLQNPQEALVRPFVASRCDLDASIAAHKLEKSLKMGALLHALDSSLHKAFGKKPLGVPFAIGHEGIGEVLSVGAEVKHIQVGQKVIIPWAISCGACLRCEQKLFAKCSSQSETVFSAYGFGEPSGNWGGLISDQVRVPYADNMLTVIPEGIDCKSIASASDNISDAYRSVGPFLTQKPKATVLVTGGAAQSIGLYAVTIAVAMGASQVDYVDTSRHRLEIAEKLGARVIQASNNLWFAKNSAPLKEGYDISVDAGNTPERLTFAILSTAPGGDCTSVGMYFQKKVGLPLWKMFVNVSNLHIGPSHPPKGIPEILKLTQNKKFKPELVTTCLAPWAEAPQAYREKTTKVVLYRDPLHGY